jgi:acetoin utilization deacetylase AcuC-like enzyme
VLDDDGDEGFKWAIDEAAKVIDGYAPNVILLAAGADGHEGQNDLGIRNQYTYAGFEYAADKVAELAEKHNALVLIGGAGGYQAFDHTPEIWARVVERIYNRLSA